MKHQRGFTLIEIMLVVFIVGILAGIAVLSVGGQQDRDLNNEAQRLYQLLRIASDEALMTGREIAVSFDTDNKYQFYHFDEQLMEWVILDAKHLKTRQLDEGYFYELDISENDIDTEILYEKSREEEATDYGDEDESFEPDILFFSDGQMTPFQLILGHEEVEEIAYVIHGKSLSGLTLSFYEE